MKKLLLLALVALGGVVNASARTIYLYPGVWNQSATNETFVVAAFDSNDTPSNTTFEIISSGPYYKAEINDNTVKMVLVRYDGSSNFDWNSIWNKTDDINITAASDALCFTIDGWHTNGEQGNSSYTNVYSELRGNFDSWGSGVKFSVVDAFEYECTLDLSQKTEDVLIKYLLRGDNWLDYDDIEGTEGKLYLDSSIPNGWVEKEANDGNDHGIILKHTNTIYKTYKITMTWDHSDWWKGWTMNISGGDSFKTVPVSVSSANYATFSCAYPLTIPSESTIAAYRADRVNESGEIIFKKVTGNIPAETGLLLKSNGEANDNFSYAESGTLNETNLMVATITETTIDSGDGYNYVLSNSDANGVGFYYVASNISSAAGKAYLHTTTALNGTTTNARAAWVFDDDNTTAIENVEMQQRNDQVFDLLGRRVSQPTKGLYIVNGKKVIK